MLQVASGQPYTPQSSRRGFGIGLETNSGRKPAGAPRRPARREDPELAGRQASACSLRVFNLFDARYFNGPVFASTGSPYYSRFPEADEVALADPTRFYAPRRIEVGVRIGLGGLMMRDDVQDERQDVDAA